MENNLHKSCKCCKNEIDINSINVSNLYLIRLDTYDYHRGTDYEYDFYIKCSECNYNSFIKISIDEAKEILKRCGYDIKHYNRLQCQFNSIEEIFEKYYPNNYKTIFFTSDNRNPEDIFVGN